MDIEGAEVEILENFSQDLSAWKHVKQLVFEYHYDRRDEKGSFSSMKRFHNIISQLKQHFTSVKHRSIPDHLEYYTFYPPSILVACEKTFS